MILRAFLFVSFFPFLLVHAQPQDLDCSRRLAEDYVPMTRTERAADYVRSLTGPHAFLYSAALAGIDQWKERPKEWGEGGAVPYARRFGSDYANHVITSTLQHGIALGLDEDDRYFSSGETGFKRRLAYALTSPFLARHADGSRSVSISAIGGVAGGSLIQQIWQPPSTGHMSNAARSFALTFAFRAGLDFVREFAPKAVGGFVR